MSEADVTAGTRLRLARQARGLSQQHLAGMAGVTRQAVSAVESGHSDPSLRVALALARALGVTVEELFGPGDPAEPVGAVPVAPLGAAGSRVALAPVGDRFVALPLRGDTAARAGFSPAGGLVAARPETGGLVSLGVIEPGGVAVKWGITGGCDASGAGNGGKGGSRTGDGGEGGSGSEGLVAVRPIGPPRPTLVVAGCDPALPLLETPLGLLDPPVAFAWWPCGSAEALRLAAAGLVHAAGVHQTDARGADSAPDIPGGADVVGFTSWREGLVIRPGLAGAVRGLADIARSGLRLVNREPGAEARSVLDRERQRLGLDPAELPGYGSRATGHLQVASAVAAGVADAGVASEPAAHVFGLGFIPLADERFDLVLPAKHLGSREAQGLLKVLASPWLLAQLASLPGYDPAGCGERG
ncbi:MAG: helix-turn-helix domain-containing protein [Streptosporangiaceae bacterium]|nr:helix-turn-helix domain-containing protein [Streptosporangiaceae bacterium]MBV9856898.1 helix-turn-helix domain-containing protein [Streptosporangiaceae bacterium]